jgi:hypothetical protein
MRALPPKHLARRESRLSLATKPEYLFESLTAIAVILVAVTFFANLPDRSRSGAAPGRGVDTTGTAATPPAAASSGNLVANWSFEQDLTGWEVLGEAEASREPQGRTSGSSASVRARGPEPGPVGLRLPGVVSDAREGSRYVASAWVRSTAPAQRVSIRLVGGTGAPRTATAGAPTLPGLAWRRLFVSHTATSDGTDLHLEVVADGVPAGDALVIDEVVVRRG